MKGSLAESPGATRGPLRGRSLAALLICAVVGGVGLLGALATRGLLAWLMALFLLLGVRVGLRRRSSDLWLVVRALGAFVALTLLLGAGMVAMWESAEVIVLHQRDEAGEMFSTRLWVVDFDGYPSFAARPPDSQRRIGLLRENPVVEVVRDGRAECRRHLRFHNLRHNRLRQRSRKLSPRATTSLFRPLGCIEKERPSFD